MSLVQVARHIQRLRRGVVAVAGAVAVLVSCDEDQLSPPPAAAPDELPWTTRDGGNDSCADRGGPGCPCDTEGARVQCGKVVERLDDRLICGKGVSVCTLGSWSECTLNNSDLSSIPLPQSSGLSLQSLGAASACTSNPCDPFCVTFLDTTQGLQNTGTNISVDPG
jgi:hypothetical protein